MSPALHPLPPGIVGDGVHDDTDGLQALLDTRAPHVCFPQPPAFFLISKTLRIHSGQTLETARSVVIRLKAGSGQILLTNDDHEGGNEHITVTGGIWDMDNLNQPPAIREYENTDKKYTPGNYMGALMRFNNVKNLTLRSLTLKDPESFGIQLGNLYQFTIEDITFDYNLQRKNMDGVHVHGPGRWGRIANLKGTTNDDLVALNADDGGSWEMSRGPIEDVVVDGIMAENGWTAVRLLSAGSPIRRIQIQNVFGTYRYNVVALTNFGLHPGEPSTFDDISIQNVFCSKSGFELDFKPAEPGWLGHAPFWVQAGAKVGSLSVDHFQRTETRWAAMNIVVEEGASVDSLQLSNISLINHTPGPIDLLTNNGRIGCLRVSNLWTQTGPETPKGEILLNTGTIEDQPCMIP